MGMLRRSYAVLVNLPLAFVFHEHVLGCEPGPLANTPRRGAIVLRASLRAAPARGSAVVFRSPLAPGCAAGTVVGVAGDARPDAPGFALQSGQRWVEGAGAPSGGAGAGAAADSGAFGPLPASLVVGTPLLYFPSPF